MHRVLPLPSRTATHPWSVTEAPIEFHIAIADDDADLRNLARLLMNMELEDVPLRITEVNGGRPAVDLCVSETVHVLVLDMHMADMDGLTVIDQVNATTDPPCIVAWSGDDRALSEAHVRGASATVIKGTDVKPLLTAIRACVERVA